jgi:hypothetical protein
MDQWAQQEETDMTSAEALARAAIEKTLAACTQAGDARKAEAYAGCFTENGALILAETFAGRETILRWMTAPSVIPKPQTPAPGFVSHHLTTCRIELTSETTATVKTYWLVISAAGVDHSGYYDDKFEQVGEDWLIASRKPRTLWVSPASVLVTGKKG